MWLADTRQGSSSVHGVDSDDTTQDVHLNHSLFSNKQHFMAQLRWTGMASPGKRSTGIQSVPEKGQHAPTLHRGPESTPGEPCRGTPWKC